MGSGGHRRNVGAVDADVLELGIAHCGKLVVSASYPACLGDSIQLATDCSPNAMEDRRILMSADRHRSAKFASVSIFGEDRAAHKRCSASRSSA